VRVERLPDFKTLELPSFRTSHGVTLLELCFTVSIAAILFAMVLVLTRYVDHLTRLRRAQAELGQWHTALNNWFAQFGEYPCYDARKGEQSDATLTCQPRGSYTTNLSNTIENACVEIDGEYVFFKSYIVGTPSHIDPWGQAYIYIAQDNNPYDTISDTRTVYTLFSCGKDCKTKTAFSDVSVIINNGDERSARDDVYFEQ
jgi:Tfp pilus assembly protein PilE